MTPAEYQSAMNDLVNFMTYMGEPIRLERQRTGIFVLFFLAILFVFAYMLKKEYWKDIH
jgi:ubiquinol-cytochrome c reductase cytochrome c1 subunit